MIRGPNIVLEESRNESIKWFFKFFYQSANNNIDEESYIERSLDFSVDISEAHHQFFPVEV